MSSNAANLIDTIRRVASTPDDRIVTEDLSEYIGTRASRKLGLTADERVNEYYDCEGNAR